MTASEQRGSGLFNSVRRLMDTGLGLAQNRLELLSLEFQEEKIRFAELLMLVCALVAGSMITLLVATFTLVLMFWDTARLPILGGLSVLYLALSCWLGRLVYKRLYKSPRPFSSSLQEFEKDRECLNGN